jgi:hypothetical protein
MSYRSLTMLAAVFLAAVMMVTPVFAGRGNTETGLIYVASQGLYYDTFATADLPMHGRFQQLFPGAGPGGVALTMYGPGEPGHLGGRWWVDANENGVMDEGDAFFLCPLLGPGRTEP